MATRDELLQVAVAENSYCSVPEMSKSTAIPASNQSVLNDRVQQSLSFLLNSYMDFNDINASYSVNRFNSQEYQLVQALQGSRDFSDREKVTLPSSIPLSMSLGNCISNRRSTREFTGDFISLDHVATLLRASVGISGKVNVKLGDDSYIDDVHFRVIASGGGLYSVSLYIVPLNVKALPLGVYVYSSREDVLFKLHGAQDLEDYFKAFHRGKSEVYEKNAALQMVFVARPLVSVKKYGARGLRFVLTELGSVVQNLNLSVTALGLGSLDYASFSEDLINDFLKMDGVSETVLHTSFIGVPG